MLKNYINIALRNVAKHKGYAFINIAGLAVGLACTVLMVLFVQDEQSYDRFHEQGDRIYRIAIDAQPPNAPMDRFALSSRPIGRFIREDFPEVEAVVRLDDMDPVVVHNDTRFYDDEFYFAEPTFFDVFTFPLLEGEPATALTEPQTIVITESLRDKYFGGQDALGRTLVVDDTLALTISGVMADFPRNSHFAADVLVSYATLVSRAPESDEWLNLGGYTYVLVREGVDMDALEEKIRTLMTDNYGEVLTSIGFAVNLVMQPLYDIYLHSDRLAEVGPTSDVTYIYVFSAIALFVLLIACINFMNLATARSMERAKEIGVRKVVGSDRQRLIVQFLCESVVMSLIALVIAVALIVVALPFFNALAGKELPYSILLQPIYLFGLVGLALIAGLLAGSYPALLLSSFPAIEVLKGSFRSSTRGVMLRQGLVVFQFAISVALIASTLVVFNQLDYMRNQHLGFDKEQVLVVDGTDAPRPDFVGQYETIKAELERLPGVQAVTTSNTYPGISPWLLIYTAEGLPEGDSRRAQVTVADHDFLDVYNIPLLAGRGFDIQMETDAAEAALVTRSMVDNLGWGTPEDALGKTVRFGGGEAPPLTVIGVVEDYHHLSLKQTVEPMLIQIFPNGFNFFSLRLGPGDPAQTLAGAEAIWQQFFPEQPFDSFFLDAEFDTQYQDEERLSSIFGTFAIIAILIACLGLFGLAAFTTVQRTKEIGVRKVLGATIPQIIVMLSSTFTRLVLIGIVLAVPVVYFAMNRWLDTFPYHAEIGVSTFIVAGVLALLIAFLTVCYQSVRAAISNPVKSLRYE